ncbi:hypothetical protein IV203_037290 [Nitzschia inconspicua]|uniref:Uncharacterized protein n=1 Tax=Nitzschia inconspicua TaxID=303405 RepID=A0A9K3LKR8_9STRA|nr:hypothetical protein IV203_006322 [Nitzschia inconspicua]KAG7364088.1 hypothetical protein IV203_037290 [Nitzschia inconspicua]
MRESSLTKRNHGRPQPTREIGRFGLVLAILSLTYVVPTTRSLATPPSFSKAGNLYLFSLKYISEPPNGSSSVVSAASPDYYNNKISTVDHGSIDDAVPYYHTSKPVRDLWKWKDQVLGDGRDFFIPKPKTLIALQTYILDHCPTLSSPGSECVILSNCARFEIIVGCQRVTEARLDDSISFGKQLANEILACLLFQQNYYSKRQQKDQGWKAFWTAATSINNAADRPQDVLTNASPDLCSCNEDDTPSIPFPYWDVLEGGEVILPHLCRVAAGMAQRPRRMDRPVLFRPFSSRDAHILLQLKRTRELSLEMKSSDAVRGGRQRKRIPLLLEYAQRAGKAARNPNIVPQLESLRTEYKAASSQSISPKDVKESARVADIAYSEAIAPLIQEYLQKEQLSLSNVNAGIKQLRSACFSFLTTDQEEEMRWMNRRLHDPILELRNHGRLISYDNSEACIKAIQSDLEAFRCRQDGQDEI